MKRIRHYCLAAIIQGAILTVTFLAAHAEDATTDGYVTRKEYEELKTQMRSMKKELDALKTEREAGKRQGTAQSQAIVESHKEATPLESAQGEAVADTHKQVATEAPPPVVEAEG